MDWGHYQRSGTGQRTLAEVQTGSGDLPRGLGRLGCSSRKSGRVGGPSRKFEMGRVILLKVRDGSGDPP